MITLEVDQKRVLSLCVLSSKLQNLLETGYTFQETLLAQIKLLNLLYNKRFVLCIKFEVEQTFGKLHKLSLMQVKHFTEIESCYCNSLPQQLISNLCFAYFLGRVIVQVPAERTCNFDTLESKKLN